ncbi:hypothetical protein E1B28_007661 [Marasmius oreades]|uniref:Uncharacterized protein n=1 Tax=Marasmius oreades TaxID=181124 RepID=A0A9P7UU96_9AGAR|nr:uncharacterized protein E1B28_007661 [Marasmius oreades]KAG7094040.1 hypothetical protein E1B28_007661 [Marasmius oreades]
MFSSPSSTPPTSPRRRLLSRRGSTTAFDPYAKHAEMNRHPDRSSFSTLTIVRVPPQQPQPEHFALHEPSSARRHHNHTRTGSGGRNGGSTGPGGGSNSVSGRLSFAFSTFAPPGGHGRGEQASSPSSSPSSSPRLRPSSPHRSSFTGGVKPRLTADQLYELAHRSTNPGYLNFNNNMEQNANFTPLPPAVYLPFIDRPSEVAALLNSTPTKKLFALLSQTFPKESSASVTQPPSTDITLDKIPSDPTKWTYTHLVTFTTQTTRSVVPDALFIALLRKCILYRSELIWERVKGALGVPPELDIDLDVNFSVEESGNVFDSSSSESGANSDMEDGGMKAKGDREGWDMVESPVVEKEHVLGISEGEKEQEEFKAKVNAALNAPPRVKVSALEKSDSADSGHTTISPTPRGRNTPPSSKHKTLPSTASIAESNEELSPVPQIVTQLPTPNTSKHSFDTTHKPPRTVSLSRHRTLSTGHTRSSSLSSWLGSAVSPEPEPEPDWSSSTPADFGSNHVDFGLSSSPVDDFGGGSPYLESSVSVDLLFIEPVVPLLSPGVLSPGVNPPPLSLEGGTSVGGEGGLGDIIEGEEEEDGANEDQEKKEEDLKKLQVQGLRLSLSSSNSTPSSPTIGSPNRLSWHSSYSGGNSPISSPVTDSNRPPSWGSSSRRSSFGTGSPAVLTRTGSSGSLTGMAMQLSAMGGPSSWSSAQGDTGIGYRYDPVGDRVPGNPLFPSNFSRLTSGPTLAANNPSLRSLAMPPATRFSRPTLKLRRGSNTSVSDYAVTLSSEGI